MNGMESLGIVVKNILKGFQEERFLKWRKYLQNFVEFNERKFKVYKKVEMIPISALN